MSSYPGITADVIIAELRHEERQKVIASLIPWKAPPSNCPNNGAHHYISDGNILTCKHCGDTKKEVRPHYSYFNQNKAQGRRKK